MNFYSYFSKKRLFIINIKRIKSNIGFELLRLPNEKTFSHFMNKIVRITILATLFFGVPVLLPAQVSQRSNDSKSAYHDAITNGPAKGVPIGAGISILISLGLALGTGRIKKMRKSIEDVT
jgi:hypothetical protein